MRLRATEAERALQDEVRSFLAQAPLVGATLPRALDDRIALLREWQALSHEAGFVGRAWPSEFGGGGRQAVEQIIVDQELAAAGAPEFINVVGLNVLGPSLLRSATTSSGAGTSPRSCPPRRSGARASASPTPAPTWPLCAPPRRETATTT